MYQIYYQTTGRQLTSCPLARELSEALGKLPMGLQLLGLLLAAAAQRQLSSHAHGEYSVGCGSARQRAVVVYPDDVAGVGMVQQWSDWVRTARLNYIGFHGPGPKFEPGLGAGALPFFETPTQIAFAAAMAAGSAGVGGVRDAQLRLPPPPRPLRQPPRVLPAAGRQRSPRHSQEPARCPNRPRRTMAEGGALARCAAPTASISTHAHVR